ncbi:tRNA-splicing endonuclease subunit sen54 [Savitreella phatthalungensis]
MDAYESPSDEEIDAPDYRLIAALKKDASLPSRGEKDFEPDGTNKQSKVLEASREAMFEALSFERELSAKNYCKAEWFPDSGRARVPPSYNRGIAFKSMGRADRENAVWLNAEEALFLVDRGSMELTYEGGLPLSVQAAYVECLAHVPLHHYAVYAYLRRAGFQIIRAGPKDTHWKDSLPIQPSIVQRIAQIIWQTPGTTSQPTRVARSSDRIHRDTVYRSFADVYRRLSYVRTEVQHPVACGGDEIGIVFHVWRPGAHFKKSDPGTPDFHVAIVDAVTQGIPTLSQFEALMDWLKDDPKYESRQHGGKLKVGKRHCVLAVYDAGIISFLQVGEACFGELPLYMEQGWGNTTQTKRGPKSQHRQKDEKAKKGKHEDQGGWIGWLQTWWRR